MKSQEIIRVMLVNECKYPTLQNLTTVNEVYLIVKYWQKSVLGGTILSKNDISLRCFSDRKQEIINKLKIYNYETDN